MASKPPSSDDPILDEMDDPKLKKLADETRSGLEDAVTAFKAQFGAGGKESVPVGHEAEHGALGDEDVEQERIVKQKR